MRWSVKQFRWLALGGALLLAGVLAAFLGLARYRAGKVWQRILQRNGVNLVQESNGITWSQSVKGRTVFTLHAEKSTPHGNGVYSLHNAVLILYGKDGRDDRIHGNEFEYDQKQEVLKAIGEVHMDLQAPDPAGEARGHALVKGFSFLPEDAAAADPTVVHVRTSGLVFLRKLEVAATKEPVEFSFRGMRCESVGAEFEPGQGALHLLSAVKMTGTLRNAPFTLTAGRADLNRDANTVALASAEWTSEERTARADEALLTLRKDGSLDRGEGTGHVVLRSGTRSLSAPQVQTQFGAENRPKQTVFLGGVTFGDRSPEMEDRGISHTLTLTADERGDLTRAVAEGDVQLHTERPAPARDVAAGHAATTRDARAQRATASFGAPEQGRQPLLTSLHLQGAAEVLAVSNGGTRLDATRTRVRADDLTTVFLPGARQTPEPQNMTGVGHTLLEQSAADGQHRVSEGDQLEAQFGQRAGEQGAGAGESGAFLEVSRAVQRGHVVLHAWPSPKTAGVQGGDHGDRGQPSVGYAEQAVYAASDDTLTLTAGDGAGLGSGSGSEARAQVSDGSTQLAARTIVLHGGSGDGEASGGVALTSVAQAGAPATHVLASRARLLHGTDIADFYGSDREPAQMWQGSSQVSAATLVLDGRRHTLTARPEQEGGLVHGTFASEHGTGIGNSNTVYGGTGRKEDSPNPAKTAMAAGGGFGKGVAGRESGTSKGSGGSHEAVQVAAEALDYSDSDHEAVFHGHAVVRGIQGTIRGDRGVVFLQSSGSGTDSGAKAGSAGPGARETAGAAAGISATDGLGGRLDRFVLLGNVRLLQPGRSGQGEQLTYTAATDRFVLTGAPGAPPRVNDAQQGAVTGETLVFGAAERSVVVVGTPPTEGATAGRRVHTETDIKR